MQTAAVLLVLAALQTAGEEAPVVAEFRVFDGSTEVTSATRLRIWRSGQRGDEALVPMDGTIALPAALYDVEARHADRAGLVTVKRSERLSVMRYPDEQGRHLQVINLRPGFGALQLRATYGDLDPDEIALFPEGDHTAPVAQAVAGQEYVIFVVPAGRYDVRILHTAASQPTDVHWLLGVEVPADATRLKLVEGSG